MTLQNRTVNQKHETRTDTLADTLTDGLWWVVLTLLVCFSTRVGNVFWCVLHTGGCCPGVFFTQMGDVLVCSPHSWAMSWCVLHMAGQCPCVFSTRLRDVLVCSPHGWRCPGVFSTQVGDVLVCSQHGWGDVLVCSQHGWAMSWCALHTGRRCPKRLHVTAVDICIIYCPPPTTAQWSRLDTGLPNDRTPFTH